MTAIRHIPTNDKGKIGHAAADEGINPCGGSPFASAKRDDEQGGHPSRRLAFHGEEEHQDGQVERSAADTKERPAGTGQKNRQRDRGQRHHEAQRGDIRSFAESVYENKLPEKTMSTAASKRHPRSALGRAAIICLKATAPATPPTAEPTMGIPRTASRLTTIAYTHFDERES